MKGWLQWLFTVDCHVECVSQLTMEQQPLPFLFPTDEETLTLIDFGGKPQRISCLAALIVDRSSSKLWNWAMLVSGARPAETKYWDWSGQLLNEFNVNAVWEAVTVTSVKEGLWAIGASWGAAAFLESMSDQEITCKRKLTFWTSTTQIHFSRSHLWQKELLSVIRDALKPYIRRIELERHVAWPRSVTAEWIFAHVVHLFIRAKGSGS